ncbi:hypothetical protein [Pelagicoccus sp. SDUM812002]|uniref:hypothetical protein n=1 Tax=Pelagicoccus sp. SDUM812002 TaxID=3041266 RepID=UPI00280F563C|nr:hypothetical protein [Pelagicoccus sp. SDUM812002]MDQ8186627.1 hypothetical protein [Pelagicoccus sp. SDUM812002]
MDTNLSRSRWIFSQKRTYEIGRLLSQTAHLISDDIPKGAFEFIENAPSQSPGF